MLRASPSAVHVAIWRGGPLDVFTGSRVAMLDFPRDGACSLVRALEATQVSHVPLGEGLCANSLFYEGSGSYSLFRTCDLWGEELRGAGVGISRLGAVHSVSLVTELRWCYGVK